MSRIDSLIAQLCPHGVEFKAIGEFGELVRGNGMPKSDFVESGVGCIHYGQIYTYYGTSTTKTISFVSAAKAQKLAKVNPSDLIITNTSENLDDVCKAVAWVGDTQIVTGGHATVLKHGQDPKYLSYYLQTSKFFNEKKKLANGIKVIDVSAKNLAKIRIPIPPIEVQREIVKILDTFTTLNAELEKELGAELYARQQQYQHYRDALLNFEENVSSASTVRFMAIGEICEINRGRVISKDYLRDNAGEYPVYSSQTENNGVFGFIDSFDYDCESVTWTTDGANAGSVFYHHEEKFSITNVCGLLQVKNPEKVKTKYLYYSLRQVAKKHVSSGMGNPKLMSAAMFRIKIPVPSLKEQARIVAIFDRLDALANDISIALPAEIKARRQQYSYYRDRLLTFKEAA